MRALRIASLTLAGTTAALALGAPAALADPGGSGSGTSVTSFGFTVSPARVAPGGTVTLNAVECPSAAVTVSSDAFDTVTLTEGLPGSAKISEKAKPGTEYDVTFDCQGERGTAALTVGGSVTQADYGTSAEPGTRTGADPFTDPGTVPVPDPGAHTGADPFTDPGGGSHLPDLPVKPGGGVAAGSGGSLTGPDPVWLGVGSALVAGAVGGSAVLLRRRAVDGV